MLRTFSKLYGLAGLRVGYAVGPRDVCAAMAKLRRPFDVTTTAQAAALASLADPDEVARRRALNASGLAELGAILRRHGLDARREPGRQLRLRRPRRGRRAALRAPAREGVIVRPLAGFGAPTAIRVSVGTPEEHASRGALARLRLATASSSTTRWRGVCAARGRWFVAGMSTRSRLALLGNSRFRLLFVATFASGIGNWLAVIALKVDVYDRTHSGWWVGELLIANILPAVFIGLLFGPLVDRLSRKGLMIASDLGRLAVFAALPFATPRRRSSLLAVLAGIGNAFFRPAVLAGLPNLVGEDELPTANALLQLVEWTTTALGPDPRRHPRRGLRARTSPTS